MTLTEHLLVRIAEEGAEVTQRATKALVFGLNEVQEGQDLNNLERLIYEFNDLVAIMKILMVNQGHTENKIFDAEAQLAKSLKLSYWLEYSKKMGTLQDGSPIKDK